MTRATDDDPARWELHEHTEQERRELRLEADEEVVVVRASWATAPESFRAQWGEPSGHSVVNVLLPDEVRELHRWLGAVITSWGGMPEDDRTVTTPAHHVLSPRGTFLADIEAQEQSVSDFISRIDQELGVGQDP